jgi:hypothetical protein
VHHHIICNETVNEIMFCFAKELITFCKISPKVRGTNIGGLAHTLY